MNVYVKITLLALFCFIINMVHANTNKVENTLQTLLFKIENETNFTNVKYQLQKSHPNLIIQKVFSNSSSKSALNKWYKLAIPMRKVRLLKQELLAIKHVSHVELNKLLNITATTPNDPIFKQQWALNQEDKYMSGNNYGISAQLAWDLKTDSQDVVVAVLDTGVDYTHEDLKQNMWVNEAEKSGIDNVDDDGNGCVDDIYGCDVRSNVKEKLGYMPGLGGAFYQSEKYMYPDGMGHGTLVAGILGAVGNNGIGISGVSWNARIMSVKFINQNNAANMLDAVVAIKYAVDNGAKVINNSYGRNHLDDSNMLMMQEAIEYADQHGVLMIASAGNSGEDIDNETNFYPANFSSPNLITVAALAPDNTLWENSNYGILSVDIAAPGVAIWSTAPAGPTSLFRKYYDPSGYLMTEGTSISTPYISGVAALLFAHYPGISHHKVKEIILDTVDIIPLLEGKIATSGRVNLYNALLLAYTRD